MARNRSTNRRRRRGRFSFLMKLLCILLIAGAVVAALTVFFKVQSITVSGNARYTSEEVVAASGIEIEDNLFLLNKYSAAQAIFEKLPYVEEATINRALPDTIVITVRECVAAAGVVTPEGYWLISENGKLLEAQRLEQRTRYDMEMLQEIGFCTGIENYSRIMSGRAPGSSPYTLLSYFPDDFLLFVDESHVTLPQVRGMFAGDYARKKSLIDYGFRLPSALDNRPLNFDEFYSKINQAVYVSATPGDFELEKSAVVAEQIIRPTGLLDPEISVRPTEGQLDDLVSEINIRTAKNQRTLVTTLTKKMAEDLTAYLEKLGIRVRYMHHDIDTVERMEIVRDLRLGEFDVLVGINLLREGLDIPEVSLVAVLDADKEGFLRSTRSLIQIAGRAARNSEGTVIMLSLIHI